MGSRSSKPNVRGVVDLGLRDVGVENDPRQHAREAAKALPKVFALIVGGMMAACLLVGLTGARGIVFLLVPGPSG